MSRNRPVDLQRQSKRSPSILTRDHRRSPCPNSPQKGGNLQPQRLALLDRNLLERESRRRMLAHPLRQRRKLPRIHPGRRRHIDHQQVLPRKVERKVLMRLEEPQLPHPFRAHPAGGEVGDAAILKLQPHVGDIHLIREHRQPHRPHFTHRRSHQTQHDVEIVNHQVEHDIHIERTRSKHAQTMRFEEHRLMQVLPRRRHSRVEALQMPRLHDAPMLAAHLQNTVSIGEARGQRLLNQQIDARGQQRLRSGSMMHRRHADRSSIERTHRRQARLNSLKARHPELSRGFRSDSRVAVHHSSKLNRLPRLFQLAIDAKMIAPEGSRSNHGNAEWSRGRHYFFSVRFSTGASTTWRQRA